MLRDARHEGIPEIKNPNMMRAVLAGDKVIKGLESGGHNVHPVPD